MDRTNAITRLNTEEIAMEVNHVIKKGLEKLLGDHLYRYELLEKTHEAIMNLPSVRNHLNQHPFPPQYNEDKSETSVDNVKYEQMVEKLLKRIDELTFEVNQLKQTCKNECTDIKIKDEPVAYEEHIVVVKLEQKENIKLEIEETNVEEEEEEEEEEEDDEEEQDEEEEQEEDEEDENICSECDCKVILKEDIIVVNGKKYCGACDPNEAVEDEVSSEEVLVVSKEVASEAEEVASEAEEEDEVETEKSESVASEADEEEEEVVEETNINEEEEEYIEIDIDDVTYCTNNEENGFIYQLTEDGDVGDKVGYLKDGEPFFYADEK